MGIGMALLEETVSDRTGHLVTTSLAEYIVAIANAVYYATSTRARSLPISIEKVLGHGFEVR